MSTGKFCGLRPLLFGRKTSRFETVKRAHLKSSKKEVRGSKMIATSSPGPGGNFFLMLELRKKIFTFRDLIDLPPCDGSATTNELVTGTMKYLHKIYPETIPKSQLSQIKGASIDKVLIYFCEALKCIGDSWMMNQDWMDKATHDLYNSNDRVMKSDQIVEIALATLGCIIKILKDKPDGMDEEDQSKSSPRAATPAKMSIGSFSDGNTSYCTSPETPKSVLPDFTGSPGSGDFANFTCSSPVLRSLRAQSIAKLNPIDIKRLSYHMVPKFERQESSMSMDDHETTAEFDAKSKSSPRSTISDEELMFEIESSSNSEGTKAAIAEDARNGTTDCTKTEIAALTREAKEFSIHPQFAPKVEAVLPQAPKPIRIPPPSISSPTPLSPLSNVEVPPPLSNVEVSPPPPPPLPLPINSMQSNAKVSLQSHVLQPNSAAATASPPPPPPLPSSPMPETATNSPFSSFPSPCSQTSVTETTAPPPPPPPMPSKSLTPSPPPPPEMMSKGSTPPPPPMPVGKGASRPPPPPGAAKLLRPKKAQTKLKRSSEMGNLYRTLKRKIEGGNENVKSSCVRKGAASSSAGGQQGMADALAEITKRSAYFQQIEEDVQKYAKSITELKIAISNFQTKDMTELTKFHNHVESVLEDLTDETQVLGRFEGFPQKKLEALRTAAALSKKLNGMLTELQEWKIEPPLGKLLDKAERHFNKIKGDIEALERTKDEESKKLQSHNIHFDFNILLKVKEAMVDVSSNCMELALKERRAAKAAETTATKPEAKNAHVKMLWRAFQFAFRVYSFAGGHDDRADMLTRELAQEIEAEPQVQA
ncbi:hypothetical protein Tsubulata_017397 [Turnera subulata]|uniref:Uncharacterized protein n=1 Tax=Turnera subulata TaxID=218843 RepID=A0A9Q0G7S4_9ROSI|nr:hypothetical protein Tsubulata_017397 [Turnera subulata]